MITKTTESEIDRFVFDAVGYLKPPILALDPQQSASGLNEFYKIYSPSTVRVRDNDQMISVTKEIDTAIKYVKPAKKWAGHAGTVIEGIRGSLDGFSMSINGILNAQSPSAASAGLPSVYIVEEDSIEPKTFSNFVARFQQLDDEKKPRVVVVANDKLESALQLISTCGENISAHVLSSSGLTEISTHELACSDFDEFIDLFLSEGDGYCTSSEVAALFKGSDIQADFNRCTAAMIQIQSYFRCGRKFDAVKNTAALDADIDRLRERAKNDDQLNMVLSLKAISNLWISYLSEANPERIENSLSIAEHLGDDLLAAYALKLIPIVTGLTSLTHQMLEKAKKTFIARGELEQSLFIENNIVENNLFSDRIDVERAINLSQYVAENTPYIRRSTTFHSNAAIALMLTGNLVRAREVFEVAKRGSGPPVNLLTTEVNSLIADHLDGEKIEADRAMRLINKIERSKIDKNFDYHQASMFANIWRICEGNKDVSKRVRKILKKQQFLPYDKFLADPEELVKFIATRSVHLNATKPKRMPGVAGSFIDEHGLKPASHVFYR